MILIMRYKPHYRGSCILLDNPAMNGNCRTNFQLYKRTWQDMLHRAIRDFTKEHRDWIT